MRPGLIPGLNVDLVDVAAGVEHAKTLGYTSSLDRMVVEYALMRHQRGEEAGAESTWCSYFPHDLTSWKAILATAITTATTAAQGA